jgi:type IV pilus assembly protein PilE
MAIIAFLAAIGWPAYQNYTTASRRSSCQAGLVSLQAAMERHHTVNNTYASAAAAIPGAPLGTVHPSQAPMDQTLAANRRYCDLVIQTANANSYTLRANPVNMQSGDGFLQLTSAGAKGWDQNDNGTIDAGENKWGK